MPSTKSYAETIHQYSYELIGKYRGLVKREVECVRGRDRKRRIGCVGTMAGKTAEKAG